MSDKRRRQCACTGLKLHEELHFSNCSGCHNVDIASIDIIFQFLYTIYGYVLQIKPLEPLTLQVIAPMEKGPYGNFSKEEK